MLDVKPPSSKECQRRLKAAPASTCTLGSRDVLCKLVLDDREQLTAEESGYAQLWLTGPHRREAGIILWCGSTPH